MNGSLDYSCDLSWEYQIEGFFLRETKSIELEREKIFELLHNI